MKNCYEELFEYVDSLPIIDSHEHLPTSEERRGQNMDVLMDWLHYFGTDLMVAGLKNANEIRFDSEMPVEMKWKIIEPYWEFARNTGYYRAMELSAKGIYGIDHIDGSTIGELAEKFQESLKPGQNHFRRVLKDLCRIEYCVLDQKDLKDALLGDPAFFRDIYRLNDFVCPQSWEMVAQREAQAGISVTGFDSWLELCRLQIEGALDQGAVGLKCNLSYLRSLDFARADRREAESCFNDMLRTKRFPYWECKAMSTTKAFQDYMMHFILEIANRRGVVIQFHTGIQAAGGNMLADSNPMLLNNLFVEYPNIKFDLFHMGYPFQNTLSALGKMFPNVYLDMCWAHMISPAACVQILDDWLDAVPVNKIIAFGGDCRPVDVVYGHLVLAKQNVSRALAKKVEEGSCTLERAKWMARRMFYDNPKELYGAGTINL